MTYHVFISYSRNDPAVAGNLRDQLAKHGLSVFKDDERIRAGELWLDKLQVAVDGCGAFVVLVGRDGVGRWIGAETQAALNRHFAPHDDAVPGDTLERRRSAIRAPARRHPRPQGRQ